MKKRKILYIAIVFSAILCISTTVFAKESLDNQPTELSSAYKGEEARRIQEAIEKSEEVGLENENPLIGILQENLPLDGSLAESPFEG